MQKKRDLSSLSSLEKTAGTVFFAVYLLVLPAAAPYVFRFIELLLGMSLSGGLETAIYHYVLFAVTAVIFSSFLIRTSQVLLDNLSDAAKTFFLGLVALYGGNELAYRLAGAVMRSRPNLNDVAIGAGNAAAPHTTALIVVFLAPFVEEVLFRGLVFGALRGRSRRLGYGVSCALFALAHVWQGVFESGDPFYLVLVLQYLVPGAVLCWAYEHSGTLWCSVAVHAAANGMTLWAAGR